MAAIKGKSRAMSAVRKKQLLLLLGLGLVIVGIAGGAAFMASPKKPVGTTTRTADATRKAFGTTGGSVSPADIWRTQEGARVTDLQQQLADMKAKMQARDRFEADEKKRAEDAAIKKADDEKIAKERERVEMERRQRLPPPANALPLQGQSQAGMPPGLPGQMNNAPPQAERVKGIMRLDMSSGGTPAPMSGKGATTVRTNGMSTGSNGSAAQNGVGEQRAESYIPPGTFMRGLLLAGLDAPTGGQSQQNPTPVVLEVLDMASLPNNFRADYKSCRFTGNGDGDLSSERAYIRLDRMACVTMDGGAIDVGIKGYVADSSGKAGVRGRLVTKQGQVLANALLAAVAGGIGTAFQQNATTTSTSPLGSTTSVKDGEAFRAGMGQGVNTAMHQLANFYIKLAEKMFPVIEVDAGLPVDIIITKGISVARRN